MQTTQTRVTSGERVPLAVQYRGSGFRRRWRNCSQAAQLLAELSSDALGLSCGERGLVDCAINEMLELAWQQGASDADITIALSVNAGAATLVLTTELDTDGEVALTTMLREMRAACSARGLFDQALQERPDAGDAASFGVLWLLADLGFELGAESAVVHRRLDLRLALPR